MTRVLLTVYARGGAPTGRVPVCASDETSRGVRCHRLSGSALGVVRERGLVLMFGCCARSCLQHVGEDADFPAVEGAEGAWLGHPGGLLGDFFPYQVSAAQKDFLFFSFFPPPAGRYHSPGMGTLSTDPL